MVYTVRVQPDREPETVFKILDSNGMPVATCYIQENAIKVARALSVWDYFSVAYREEQVKIAKAEATRAAGMAHAAVVAAPADGVRLSDVVCSVRLCRLILKWKELGITTLNQLAADAENLSNYRGVGRATLDEIGGLFRAHKIKAPVKP